MDYSVGSVAALISGNVTPNRPRLIKRALTPIKHQQSPNVTPKSEFVDDRSIFLSPSLQRKKAIVKKSPKRIFQNPDLDVTNDGEGNSALLSPKAEKVKKHLKDDLDADQTVKTIAKSPKSLQKGKGKANKSLDGETSTKLPKFNVDEPTENLSVDLQTANENTPKKKKKQRNSTAQPVEEEKENITDHNLETVVIHSPISSKKKHKSEELAADNQGTIISHNEDCGSPKKKRKHKKSEEETTVENNVAIQKSPKNSKKTRKSKDLSTEISTNTTNSEDIVSPKKKRKPDENTIDENLVQNQESPKKKKNKKKKSKQNHTTIPTETMETDQVNQVATKLKKKKEKLQKKQNKVHLTINPNAITNKDSDSEHDSDNEIESENEQFNSQVLDTGPNESDSSDDEKEDEKTTKTKSPDDSQKLKERDIDDEIQRTIFVGNVPFSKKCKKEVKSIFLKHGPIDSVRIRTVPVKDARVTPKLAVIKNELHPQRTTVNVYVKFTHPDSVEKALSENNTVLNGYHLRVTRSEVTGTVHDPKKAVFVGNLPFNTEDDVLRAKFERCGDIESVRIIRDRTTNAGKGFGYVNFSSKDAVELALAMSEEDLTIRNKILRVKRCTLTMGKRGQNHPERPAKAQDPKGPPAWQEGPNRQLPSGRSQGPPGWSQGPPGKFQGHGRAQSFHGRHQGPPGRFQGRFEGQNQAQDGAYRRLMKKRAFEEPSGAGDSGAGVPVREKKPRKEFVGMTAEKKKKRKFDKGQKKRKVISEILTKK